MSGTGAGFPLTRPANGAAALTLRLTMTSDWHVGIGAGQPGGIDRLVARDADALPFVPAKTLTGIYRDACERLAAALDAGGSGWADLVTALFGGQPNLNKDAMVGAPCPAALSIRPARVPADLAAALRPERMAPHRAALTFVKPGVAIDPESGRAKDQHLRFEEMARMGAELVAPATLAPPADTSGEAWTAASALLLAATRLVEALGGKRRRGAGCATLTIDGCGPDAVDAAIDWLEQHSNAPAMPVVEWNAPCVAPDNATHGGSGHGGFVRRGLTVRLDTPLSVPARTLGNVGDSLDFVPGTLLLPAVTRALAAAIPDEGGRVRAAVTRGDLRVLPLTPEVAGRRGLPAPLVFAQVKDSPDKTVVNRLRTDREAQLKPVRGGYVAAEGECLLHHAAGFTLHTHNTIDDRVQRPTEDVGGLYAYRAIPAGTVLRTEVLARSGPLADALKSETFRDRMAGGHRLGRSKKDDFGAVDVTVMEPSKPPASSTARHGGAEIVVWCLSDLLLRDDSLRPATRAEDLAKAVERVLGVTVKVAQPASGCVATVIRTRRLESWHEGWGLPRPSLVAIAAGSCAVLSVTPPPGADALARLEEDGLGERRAEGYGAVAVNPPLLMADSLRLAEPAAKPKRADGDAAPTVDGGFARLIEEEAWRAALRQAALVAGADATVRADLGLVSRRDATPGMSQLGNLWVQAQALKTPEDAEDVLAWFKALESVTQRRKRWPERARLAFAELFADTDTVWRRLGHRFREPPPLTGRGSADLRRALWAEAVRAFLQSVLHNHKRALDATAGDAGGDTDGEETGHAA